MRLLKQILSVPITVADPAIYILSGVLPVEALIHKRILSLFGNITRLLLCHRLKLGMF